MNILLAIDLSTTNTGYARFCLDTKKLLEYGDMAPDSKGLSALIYPHQQLEKIRRLADKLLTLLDKNVKIIVIEEVNRGKNRLGQKMLDAAHFILLDRMSEEQRKKVIYVDSDGATGWRSKAGLGLQLSTTDRLRNKGLAKLNKQLPRGKKIKKTNIKALAMKFVNETYGTSFSKKKEEDVCDAIGLGHYYVHYRIK